MIRRATPLLVAWLAFVGLPATAKPPTLTLLYPAGGPRGQTTAVTAAGNFDHWPAHTWTNHRGVTIASGEEKGKLAITVADDAEPGVCWLRLHDEEGVTALRPFVIGNLPEIMEVEPNDGPKGSQPIAGPSATVNGRLGKRGDVDGFAFALDAGRTLVADLEANRHLGSPMDAVLQVATAEGFVLAQNDDTDGRDPRLIFRAPTAGNYTIRVFAFPATPDSSIQFAGGENYIYRLTLTTAGFLDHAFPLAVPPGSPGPIAAFGQELTEAARLLSIPERDDDRGIIPFSHPLAAGSVKVRRVAVPTLVEVEPNDASRAQQVPDRCAVSGRIDPPGDRDAYRLTLKKGDTRAFRVDSRGLGLPLDGVLKLFGPDGKPVAESDDAGEKRDPELSIAAPADGEYRVEVSDLSGRGGPRFAYLLLVTAPEPDFTLTVPADHFELNPGQSAKVVVTVTREGSYDGPIEMQAEGLPEGVSAAPVISKSDDPSAKSVTLELTSGKDSHPGPFHIVGKAAVGTHKARAPIAGFDATTDQPWLAIVPSSTKTAP